MTKQRYELRDDAGRLVAILEMIEPSVPIAEAGIVELAADVAGASYRLRIFTASARQRILAAA